ncbi:hypothetical protein ACVWYH_010172 [Bradyrhizobium sp. GM24.11]
MSWSVIVSSAAKRPPRPITIDGSKALKRAKKKGTDFGAFRVQDPCSRPYQDLGMTPGPLSGHWAISFSSMLKCWATSFGGVCVNQLESETSS